MKTRIEFTATLDVYTDGPESEDEAAPWVRGALSGGDKHAGDFTTFLGKVTSVGQVGDDE
jgi:hypothetical protein